MHDIVIKNGTVIDGTGKAKYKANIAVKDSKIAKVGKLSMARGEIEIDAGGKIVSPGFIDVHNHSDSYWRIFLNPELPSLAHQGVTTIIGGNCGASIAPLTDGRIIESIQKWADIKQINVDWLSMAEFREAMAKRKFALNFATLVGHGTLRRGLIHDEVRRLDRKEMELMKNLLEKSLEAGALGLSTGLAYSHEKIAAWDEIVELAEIVKAYGRVYSTHLRNESRNIIPALEEAVSLAEETGVSLEISHLKVMGEENWRLMDEVLEKIKKAADAGLDVNFDVYPYTQTGSVLYIFLPDWAAEGGKHLLLKRLKDKQIRKKIIEEMKQDAEYDYGKTVVAISPLDKSLTRRKIDDIAESQGVSAEEAIINLLSASEGRVITLVDCLSEDNVRKAIRHPLSIIATDGSGYDIGHKISGELVHPRCFGTFPRVLGKYVRKEKLLSLEEAVRKMTGDPARKFGLKNRGRISNGCAADLVIFDPKKISDRATAEDPYQYSQGIEGVIVNGKLVMANGKLTGELPGRFLSG